MKRFLALFLSLSLLFQGTAAVAQNTIPAGAITVNGQALTAVLNGTATAAQTTLVIQQLMAAQGSTTEVACTSTDNTACTPIALLKGMIDRANASGNTELGDNAGPISAPDAPRAYPPGGIVNNTAVAQPPATPLAATGVIASTQDLYPQGLKGVDYIIWEPVVVASATGNSVVVENLLPDGQWVIGAFTAAGGTQQNSTVARQPSATEMLVAPVLGVAQRLRQQTYVAGSAVSYIGMARIGPLPLVPGNYQTIFGDASQNGVDTQNRPINIGGDNCSTRPTVTAGYRVGWCMDTHGSGAIDEFLYNPKTTDWEQRTNNFDTGALVTTSASAAGSYSAASTQINYNNRGVVCTLSLSSIAASSSAYIAIKGIDATSGNSWVIGQLASQSANGVYTLEVYPGVTTGATTNVASVLPRNWTVSLVTTGVTTGSVACSTIG